MHAPRWRSKRCWTMSSHQWALTDVRPVCCLADFAILNLLIASLSFFLSFLPVMLRSVGQARSPLLGLSMQGLAGEWESPGTREVLRYLPGMCRKMTCPLSRVTSTEKK